MHGNPVHRTRVKICGITRPEDALRVAEAGADAIGLVFYARSPRAVGIELAREIAAVLPPFVTTVGLFVDAAVAEVEAVLAEVPLDLLQFHGRETPEECERYRRPYIKAVPMREDVDLEAVARAHTQARALLLDTHRAEMPGGTGARFNWDWVPSRLHKPLIVAGGLDPENVASAIHTLHPWGVDVSSGVEAHKGIKDAQKIAAFMRGVESADAG